MARHLFGYTAGDFVVALGGATLAPIPNAAGTVWTAKTGGAQLTDLLDAASSPVTAVHSESDGRVGFYGPDGVVTCWVDFGAGRYRMDTTGTYPDGTPISVTPRPVLIDARDHGAIGDGSNVTSALAAARAAAGTNGVVRVPAGLHIVDALALSVAGQRWELWGELRATSGASPNAVIDVTGNDVTIAGYQGAKVNGLRASQSSSGLDGTKGLGIRVRGVTGTRIEGLTVADCPGEGIIIDNASGIRVARVKVANCNQNSNRKSVYVYAATGACSDITFEHLDVDCSVSGGSAIGAAANSHAITGWSVEHCKTTIGAGAGGYTLGVEAYTPNPSLYAITDVQVTECRIEGADDVNHGFGVSLGGVVRGVSAGNIARNCQTISFENIGQSLTCVGNVAEDSGYISIAAAFASQVTRGVVVSDNTIASSSAWAIEVNGGPASVDDCMFHGNRVTGGYINWAGTTTDVTFAKNRFKGTTAGFVQQGGSAHSGWKIHGNTIDGTGVTAFDAIQLTGSTDGEIDFNRIRGFRHAVYGYSNAADIRVRGNTITGAASDGILCEATSSNWTIAGGNAVTGCGGWGVKFNGAPTGMSEGGNRVTGNTSGQVNTASATLVPLV